MRIPHDKCPPRVAKIRFLLLLMQLHKFFRHPNAASQVAFFLTQTFLHLIDKQVEQVCPTEKNYQM